MASQFATENGHKIARLLKYYEGSPYNIPEILDVELQEVRDVVKLVAHPKFDAGGDGIHYYLTKADIQRARALMEKLEVRP